MFFPEPRPPGRVQWRVNRTAALLLMAIGLAGSMRFVRYSPIAPPPPAPAPIRTSIGQLLSRPIRFDRRAVSVNACYSTDGLEYSNLVDPHRPESGAIAPLGDWTIPDENTFDPYTEQVCGTFIGEFLWQPHQEPVLYVFNDAFLAIERTERLRRRRVA